MSSRRSGNARTATRGSADPRGRNRGFRGAAGGELRSSRSRRVPYHRAPLAAFCKQADGVGRRAARRSRAKAGARARAISEREGPASARQGPALRNAEEFMTVRRALALLTLAFAACALAGCGSEE